ncbi:SDR family NAD(P)-dependent oxidoreductase [Candidatus Bathyarchaeota archaeon]|nr:SDR family NAD(P)-dependent oxidoreductase [Candidatus Bathyarchaeota archaeon]
MWKDDIMTPGSVAIITGVSGGIGRAILKAFHPRFERIFTASRRDIAEFWDGKYPSNTSHVPGDLTIESNVQRLFDRAIEKMGHVDLVVNCVGGSLVSGTIKEFNMEDVDRVLAVNLRSAFMITKHALKHMEDGVKQDIQDSGNIVHFVSSSAKKISHGKAPYGIAKAALAHLIHYAAFEAAESNVNVNGISPTYVFTARHERSIRKKMNERNTGRGEVVERITSSQLLRKELQPEDLLEVTWLLATTRVITGQIYNCTLGEINSY